jgi:D-alanyl-D-alanine carboxypeptidase/D-alanyl-D-alanine-endopeptidase (penicillin-binding protein 4)
VNPSRTAEGVEVVDVAGGLRAGDARDVFPRSVNDAALYAGSVFALQLEAVGIEVTGSVKRASGRLPVTLATHEGRPLAEIVRLFMKYSNNSIAESLVKSLAVASGSVPGSWPAGIAALQAELGRLGLVTTGAVLRDGSGLSPDDRVSARMLVDALRLASDSFRFGPEFVSSMPIANRDGTLARRAAASADRLRAKTGLLSDQRVTTLSGYAEMPDGEVAVFSILLNGHPGSSAAAIAAVDRLAAELTR